MEQMDPDPFLEELAKYGLPWFVKGFPLTKDYFAP